MSKLINLRHHLTALFLSLVLPGCIFTKSKSDDGRVSLSSDLQNQGNGQAYDRLTYVIISPNGVCPDGSPLQSQIVLVNGVARLLRDKCQALPSDQQRQVNYTIDPATNQIIVVNGEQYYQIQWSNLWSLTRDGQRNMYVNGFGVADRNISPLPPYFEAISKLDENGVTVWSKFVPKNLHFENLNALPDGRLVVSIQDFNEEGASPNASPSAVVMLGKDGKVLWSNSWVDSSLPFGPFHSTGSVAIDSIDGSVYSIGLYTPPGSSRLQFLTKFSSTGAVLWQKKLPIVGPWDLKVSPQGEVLLYGSALIRISSTGEMLSSLVPTLGGPNAKPFIDSASVTSTGNWVITGSDGMDYYGNYSQYIALITNEGQTLWSQRVLTGSKRINPLHASVAPDDSIFVSEYGATDSAGTSKVGKVIHLSAAGLPLSEVKYQGPLSPSAIGSTLIFGAEKTMWAIATNTSMSGAYASSSQSLLKIDISSSAPSCYLCFLEPSPSVSNIPLILNAGPELTTIQVPFDGPAVIPGLVESPIPVSVSR